MIKQKPKRIFLRLPVELYAKLFLAGKSPISILIDDLSSSGFSFRVPASLQLPDAFLVRLRLGVFSKEIPLKVNVTNRVTVQERVRIGCKFVEITTAQKKRLIDFVNRNMDVFLLLRLLRIAAFICVADSLWRLGACLVYAQGLWFDGGRGPSLVDYFYFAILLLYMCVSAIAFLAEVRLSEPKAKQHFFLSVACLAIASCIMIARTLFYWWTWLVQPTSELLNVLVVSYTCGVGLVLVATRHGLVSFKKLDTIIQILKQHRVHLQEPKSAS